MLLVEPRANDGFWGLCEAWLWLLYRSDKKERKKERGLFDEVGFV
jgi:hypothetical protein